MQQKQIIQCDKKQENYMHVAKHATKQIDECDNCKPRQHTEAGKLHVCSKTCHRK